METITVSKIAACLEQFAPLPYQENYDNSGLLTGSPSQSVSGVLVTLDCTEAVLEEALSRNCNMIVAHHPIIFKGLKKLTGSNYVERTIAKAIKNDIALYAIHTNIDSVHNGVSRKMADRLGLIRTSVLYPKQHTLAKLVSFAPKDHMETIMEALHQAGAGQIGKYEKCSFSVVGTGTFMPTEGTKPYIGTQNQVEHVNEIRFEVVYPSHRQKAVVEALHTSHPYEEVAYYLTQLENQNQEVGLGIVGHLEQPMDAKALLTHVKQCLNTACIRHTPLPDHPMQKIALCGGAGSFLLPHAMACNADAYLSADFKYHDFFEADRALLVADVGHYESEQFTKELIQDILRKKFPTFAVALSSSVTNPVHYF